MSIQKLSSNSKTTEVDTSIKNIIATYEKEDWASDIHLVGLFTDLKEQSEQLTSAILKQGEKSTLDGLDGLRDSSITGFYYNVKGYLHSRNKTVRTAAETVMALFDTFTLSIRNESYAVESSLVDSLLEQLAEESMTENISRLPGLLPFVLQLTEDQKVFKSAHVNLDESHADDAQKVSATVVKKEILSHFNGSVQLYMNAMAHVDDSRYGNLTRVVSEIVSENNRAVKKRLANN